MPLDMCWYHPVVFPPRGGLLQWPRCNMQLSAIAARHARRRVLWHVQPGTGDAMNTPRSLSSLKAVLHVLSSPLYPLLMAFPSPGTSPRLAAHCPVEVVASPQRRSIRESCFS